MQQYDERCVLPRIAEIVIAIEELCPIACDPMFLDCHRFCRQPRVPPRVRRILTQDLRQAFVSARASRRCATIVGSADSLRATPIAPAKRSALRALTARLTMEHFVY